ncbi:YfhO family protein [Streptomyces sp. PLK6-54]|uniref:YfhO family protein n=1 Tax=Actinacidiphila acidipaludis TaxID=2873382 RepID=A0ABS7Q223_9ACTN|nr:YfhO family protein [Streptomyces acidipaludis]
MRTNPFEGAGKPVLTSGRTAESAAVSPARASVERARARVQALAALVAALSAMGAYCLAMAVHGTYPFGPRSRAVNDLGNQFVPLHAHLWDLLRGRSTGDLLFNWNSGYGVPFLADFFTYLTNPFSWLVVLVPRDAIQVPVFLVTLLSLGLGTALMTVFLGRLQRGSPWLRAALAVGYGLSSWMISDGFSDPMWMWVLVSLPLLGIVGDWALHGRRWVPGTLLVAVCWLGNFYTAAMATLGMGLVLLVRLALDERPLRERGRAVLRAASMTAVGVALAAPVLTVTYRASKAAQPGPVATYAGPPSLRSYLAHLLPGGPYPSGPRVSVGVLALLLVLTFPFIRRVPVRERVLWPLLLFLVALSYVWEPTILLWHGLAMPNGSPYRAAVTMTAMLTSVAWLALARRPRPKELLGGAGLLALLFVAVIGNRYLTAGDWAVVLAGAVLAVGLLLLLGRGPGRRGRAVITAVLACSVVLACAYNVYAVTVRRDRIAQWQPKRTFDAQSLSAAAAVQERDDWPASRTDTGPHEFADNDPLLLGGEGGSYYSSYVPERSAAALQGLGAAWYIQGRHLLGFNDPVSRAIMGVSSYLVSVPHTPGPVRRTAPAPPVVTLRPGAAFDGTARDASVFARQERVLGSKVYTVPALTPTSGPAPTAGPGDTWHLPGTPQGAPGTTFTARCAPGSLAYVYTPWFTGDLRANGAAYRADGVYRMTDNGLLPVGSVPADGVVSLRLSSPRAQNIPRLPLGCLDASALTSAITDLRASAPATIATSGHTISATFRSAGNGTAVIAVPAVEGWTCAVDGAGAKAPGTLGGLMAVRLAGSSHVACSFRPPGLGLGLLMAGLALALLPAVAIAGRIRSRSSRPVTENADAETVARRPLLQRGSGRRPFRLRHPRGPGRAAHRVRDLLRGRRQR